ncbi:hypothetical protein Dsin_002681 [Dipteronia sinensis]|uniref:Uncharacterized protein n=1 Tax=Dipteronia sinensis TaxID=43782 RepID=A0AAE0ELG3_9ROSI|nr:hypothetical protein Dsin_002681 [Dipteronia sinensis]
MATPGYYLAEAHVLRKMHKEKMKRIEQDQKANIEENNLDQDTRSSGGCFLWKVNKKRHTKRVSSTDDVGKIISTGEMG